ncbi:MAG: T9SS type A sorting domain-containing protein, partial [Calditrichota bacterium]
FEAKSFQLDTRGLTAKSVRAKITLETNCIREISPKVTGNAEIPPGINPARINAKRSNLLLTKSFMEGNDALDKSIAQELATVEINLPVSYSLEQNYPNPFNPVTRIPYNLAKDGEVSIMVYNVRGQKVTELINGFKPAGTYPTTFDGTGLASGIYFYRIKAGEFTDVKRMLLVK